MLLGRRGATFDQDISRKLVVVLVGRGTTTGDAEWEISGITGFVTLLDEHRRERVISSADRLHTAISLFACPRDNVVAPLPFLRVSLFFRCDLTANFDARSREARAGQTRLR